MEEYSINISHEELMEITATALNELLAQDTFLCDLPKGVTLEEVNNKIALQYGQSITVYVTREDNEVMPVIVPQVNSTVMDLKKSIQRFINLKMKRSKKKLKRHKLISWKYIWKTYCLRYGNTFLTDNNMKLSDLGIRNKSQVTFVKKKKTLDC